MITSNEACYLISAFDEALQVIQYDYDLMEDVRNDSYRVESNFLCLVNYTIVEHHLVWKIGS